MKSTGVTCANLFALATLLARASHHYHQTGAAEAARPGNGMAGGASAGARIWYNAARNEMPAKMKKRNEARSWPAGSDPGACDESQWRLACR